MTNYPFSQLMRVSRFTLQGASLQLDRYPAKTSNTADEAADRTVGGATLADSSVAPSRRSRATNVSVASRSQTKVAVRQLRKESD